MKKLILLLLFISNLDYTYGQNDIVPLKVGDRVPDLRFPVLGYQTDSISISDFNGKVLLLDFWSTWCKTCIEQFPKLTGLRVRFADDLIIMPLAAYHPVRANIPKFYQEKMVPDHRVDLPTAFYPSGDTLVHGLFQSSSLPHIIWIGRDQTILAITDHHAVTESNLIKAINGDSLDFKVKIRKRRVRHDEPFLIYGQHLIEASALAPYIDSIAGDPIPRIWIEKDRRIMRFYNLPVPLIYRSLYARLWENTLKPAKYIKRNQMKILGGLTFKEYGGGTTKGYDNYQMDEFLTDNMFNYEFVATNEISVREFMLRAISDLDKRLRIKSSYDGETLILDSL